MLETSEQNPDRETLREKECATDVPTIEYIYKHPDHVMGYFNRLGRKLWTSNIGLDALGRSRNAGIRAGIR